MKEVKEKLDKIQDEVVEIKQILAVNTRELEIHIEGVKLAREQNEILKKEMETGFQNLYTEIKPIKAHVSFVKGAMWTIYFLII